jgi:protein-L-isoaspartate(D-aspartate) O-methyltransferase
MLTDYARQRQAMVENQLRPNRVDHGPLLTAMGELPRELFCPPHLRGVAYGDDDVDLGNGRHLIEPLALARMIQSAVPRASDTALVIGCDTGYAAAVLSRLVANVSQLVPKGDEAPVATLLTGLGCNNVVVVGGDAAKGLPGQRPFDIILLAGSVAHVPRALLGQLREGGCLVCVVSHGRAGKLTLCRKFAGGIGTTTPFDASIPPYAALQAPPAFAL